MDRRGITLADPDSMDARRLAGICLAAMEELHYRSAGLEVVVAPDPKGRPDVDAFAFDGGVWVTPRLLEDHPLRWAFVVYEEVGHRYLNEAHGIPHEGDFLDRFAQECFASWFQCQRMLDGPLNADDMIVTPIAEHAPSPSLGQALGKHVGSANGGSYKNADLVDEWYQDPEGPPGFKAAVMEAVAGLSFEGAPSEVAATIARAHAEARKRGC